MMEILGVLQIMKRILSVGCVLATLFTVSLLLTADENVKYAKLKTGIVPQWENLKDSDIIPCPKQIKIDNSSIPVNDLLAIYIGKSPSERIKTAAADLQQFIKEKTMVQVPIITDEDLKKNLIIIGTVSDNPQIKSFCDAAKIDVASLEMQGYAIFPQHNAEMTNLILAGKDEQGTYWAAMTLTYLIKNNAICVARIIDWPDFKNRMCENMMRYTRMLYQSRGKETQEKEAWQLVENAIREAARLKYNYISCNTSTYDPPPHDFPLDYRAQVLRKIGEQANRRGIKLYVCVNVAMGIKGEEAEFPQLKDCFSWLHFYTTWSDDFLINRACQKITRMAEIIGPQEYYFHSPDVPHLWNKLPENDRKRWGDDAASAQAYVVNKFYSALKQGNPDVAMTYVPAPYVLGIKGYDDAYGRTAAFLVGLNQKLSNDICLVTRETSMESAQEMIKMAPKLPREWYIETASFLENRLVSGTSRIAKSYYFENNDRDFFHGGFNTSFYGVHKVQLGITAEYAWNTQAPGNLFVSQKDGKMVVEGAVFQEWQLMHDLDGPVRDLLVPRACRQYFGEKTGNILALAHSVGGIYNMDSLGGPPTIPFDKRGKYSSEYADALRRASAEMAKLWDHPDLFNPGTYKIYQSIFKYPFVFQYLEKINSYLMQLSWIAESGKDEDKVNGIVGECTAWIKKAREEIRVGYDKYHFEQIDFGALRGATIGDLKNVNDKIDNLEQAVNLKVSQLKMFGAGNMGKMLTTIGIPPANSKIIVDGKLDDWDMAAANILDHNYYTRKVGKQGISGSKDIIAYWTSAWDSSYFYIAVQIFDDNLSFSNKVLWQNDAIELWSNDQQFVFSINPDGKPVVESYGSYKKEKIQFAAQVGDKPNSLHPDMKYWTAEIKIPVECLKTKGEVGNSFYMAIGVDDTDPGEKASQLFFPDTYQHLALTVGATPEKNFARAFLQKKAEIDVALLGSKIQDIAKSDGTYTCVDLQLSLKAKEKVIGLSGELLVYGKNGIYRIKVPVPDVLEDEWKTNAPMQIDTGDFFDAVCGIDFILRAPGYYKIINIRKGQYKPASLGYVLRDTDGMNNDLSDKPVSKNELLYEISFDNRTFDIVSSKGGSSAPKETTGCEIVEGRKGKAVRIDGNGALVYNLQFPLLEKGLVEFWLKPGYDKKDMNTRTFICFPYKTGVGSLSFFKNRSYSYMQCFSIKRKTDIAYVGTEKINVGMWNYVAIQWDSIKNTMQLNINGVVTNNTNATFDNSQSFESMIIGNNISNGLQCCNSIIDEVKIWKVID
jgi:hypothetical protein